MHKPSSIPARAGARLGRIRLIACLFAFVFLSLFDANAALGASGGVFSFTTNRFIVSEKDGHAYIAVTRDSQFGVMEVDLVSTNGSATNGVHFTFEPATNTIRFRHFETTVQVPVAISDDTTTNSTGQATAAFLLANPRPAPGESLEFQGVVSTNAGKADLVILDDDRELRFNLERKWFTVPEPEWLGPGSTNMATATVNVVLVSPPGDQSQGVEVDYEVTVSAGLGSKPGSDFATPGVDFEEISGTLTFGPNDSSLPITISILSDGLLEFDEDIHVTLTGARGTRTTDAGGDPDTGQTPEPENYAVGPVSQATVTILDNSSPAAPKVAGALDLTFNADNDPDTIPAFNLSPGANFTVFSAAHDTNGNVIIGGNFDAVNTVPRTRLARLLPDGQLDPTFSPNGGANNFISAVVVYTNGPRAGQVLIAGGFTAVNGVQRNGIARLLTNGVLDVTFDPGTGADGPVYALALQRDGNLMIGGDFTSFDGLPRNRIVRLTPEGTLDPDFDPGSGANGPVYVILSQSGSSIVITNAMTNGAATNFAGNFPVGANSGFLTLSYNFYSESNNIILLSGTNVLHQSGLLSHEVIGTNSATGALETNYVPTVVPIEFATLNGQLRVMINTMTNAASNWTYTVTVHPNSTLGSYIAGDFTLYNGLEHGRVARLDNTGAADPDFALATGLGADDTVFALATQNGRLILGGAFQSFNSFPSSGIAALGTNAVFDKTFSIGAGVEDGNVLALAVQPDQRILVGGNFTSFNQTRRTFLARLLPAGPLDTSFLDPAYNQYAGFPGANGFAPVGSVNSIALDSAGDVVVGGLFSRVGGGTSRTEVRNRNNLARLHGGETPGPGNIELARPVFGGDENGGGISLVLRRANGTLGPAGVYLTTADAAARSPDDYIGATNALIQWPLTGVQQSSGSSVDMVRVIAVIDDELVEGNENFDVSIFDPTSLLRLGGAFIPSGVALGELMTGRGMIIENDLAPTVFSFAASEIDASENERSVTINVVRSGELSSAASVRYSTVDSTAVGSATAGFDYESTRGTLSFTSGQTNKAFTITLIDDSLVEQDETIQLALTSPSPGAVLGTNATARLTIIDNDYTPGRINLSATNYVVSEGDSAVITVRRSGGNVGVLRVQYATQDLTAFVPADYQDTFGELRWDDRDTSPRTIIIPTPEDGLVEPNKEFAITLFDASPAGALGTRTHAIVEILDDDSLGEFSFNAAEFLADENGTNVVINVIRRGGSADLATVQYATTNMTAEAGVDYEHSSGTLVFGVGQTSESFTIRIFDNGEANPEKQVGLVLSNPQPAGASLGVLTNAVLSIIDDESVNIPAGSVETDFATGTGADGTIHALALQEDGRFYIGGEFSFVNRQLRAHLARLNRDGTLDSGFGQDFAINGTVRAIDVQSDGRVLIAGTFTEVDSFPARHLARISAGGTLDNTFNIGSGADNPIVAVKEVFVGTERKILIGGNFSVFNGIARRGIARVSEDGRTDLGFNPGSGVNGTVHVIETQRDGKILIGGEFSTVDGVPRINIARLNPDGSLDRTFDAGLGADGSVTTIAIQYDDRILLGGMFTSVSSVERRHIARLFPDGALDASFNPGAGANRAVYAVAVQLDGKILVAGDFTAFNNVSAGRIVRLNPDGQVDPSINFGPGANAFVSALVVQPDRRILLGGGFTEAGGLPRNRYARLYGGSLQGAGQLEFAAPSFVVNESATNVLITVRRSGGLLGQVTARYETRANTALPDVDYRPVSGTLVFGPGENVRTFVVPVIDDNIAEPNEFVDLILSDPTGGAVLGNQPVALIRIVSDDSIVGFAEVSYSVNEGATGGRALITIRRDGETSLPASVTFVASSGTATAGSDFTAVNTVVVIPAGESNTVVQVPIINDQIVEENESVVLQLISPGPNVSLGRAGATLVILDDDVAPGILSVSPIAPVSEGAGSFTVTITRTSGKTGSVSVQYAFSDRSATAGSDYVPASGSLFFLEGETVKTLVFSIINDDIVEGDEVFAFQISSPTGGAQLGTASQTITILDDDLPSGSLDTSFNLDGGANGPIRALGFAHGNRFLIGGDFTAYSGVPRSRVARLNSNGTLDSSFSAEPGPNGSVRDIELDPEGRIHLAGSFNSVQGALLNRIARLQTDGALDLSFALPLGFNAEVSDLLRQPDGGIVLGGRFDMASAARRSRIARILPDGTLDLAFNPGSGADGDVSAVVAQDGKILMAGSFRSINGVARQGIARLELDGTVDLSFNRNGTGAAGSVNDLVLLENGKILIGGDFIAYNSAVRSRIALLNADGSIDSSFASTSGPNAAVHAMLQQTDGKFVIGGEFTSVAGVPRNRIARLNANGSIDATFAPGGGVNGPVYAMLLQPADGKVVVAGAFTQVDSQPRAYIARLNNDRAFNVSRAVTFTPVTRSDGGLELNVNAQAGFTYTLERSTDLGASWIPLQSRVADGVSVTFPASPTENRMFFRIRRD